MTCIKFDGGGIVGFVCVNDTFRFHVGNRYVWMSWHNYTGPSFYTTVKGKEIEYDPTEDDPVWIEFDKWHKKHKAANVAKVKT